MNESIYQVLTPAGAFQVAFGDDENPITEYRGDELAIQFFKDWLLLNQVSGQDGWRIYADSLDPSDLYGFCQPPGSGITVLPPFEDLISYALDDQPDEQEPEDMTAAILDAATGREALQLAKELKQIRAGIAELTGRAALTAAKRIRDIRQALGVGKNSSDDFMKKALGIENSSIDDERLLIEYGFKKSKSKSGSGMWAWIKNSKEIDISLDVFKIGGKYIAGKKSLKSGKDGRDIASGEILLDVIKSVKDQYPSMFNEQSSQKATIADVNAVMPLIKQFVGKSQLAAMGAGVRGEEGQFFKDKFVEVAKVIEGMPKTYETDGQGNKAVAYLHYFKGAGDWYITEKDSDTDGEGQIQAFGYADLGQGGGELGYISVKELIESGVELDLYWSPKSIGEVKGKISNPTHDQGGDQSILKSHGGVAAGDNYVSEQYGEVFTVEYIKAADKSVYPSGYKVVSASNSSEVEFLDLEDAKRLISLNANSKGDNVTDTDQQNPLKSAFIAELEGLKAETDIEAYNSRLDEIAARVENAGLMEELDAELNSAADVLTELLAAAENS